MIYLLFSEENATCPDGSTANRMPQLSTLTITKTHIFHHYELKYIDSHSSSLQIEIPRLTFFITKYINSHFSSNVTD